MKHSRRVSPRISYDEAVCLTRVDGKGRLFGRSVDLAPTGIYVTSADLCEIGTELVCSVLLPGGPRHLRGRVVRLVALP
ncbi:MAG TPA: PilZ domain-containing protein, partial [Polyangia bacterium]|nr:PilZ domain-containing protein [Polyangia bacterium]